MPDPKTLHPAWRAYRRWLFIAVGGLVMLIASGVVLQNPATRTQGAWLGLPFLAVLAVTAIAMMRVWFFHCPNCGSRFHHEWGSFSVSFSQCQHCGLPLWGDPWGAQPPRDAQQ